MANKTNAKQITLHFTGDNTQILDMFKANAKNNFRSLEQEILFELYGIYNIAKDNAIVPPPSVPTEHDINDMAFEADEGGITL